MLNNDYDNAIQLVQKGKLTTGNYFQESVLLIRLWKSRGLDEQTIKGNLASLLERACKGYTQSMIQAVVHDAFDISSTFQPLQKFFISFSDLEIAYIHSLHDAKRERIFFALVCIRKIENQKSFTVVKTDIQKLAKTNWNSSTLQEVLTYLCQNGYIHLRVCKGQLLYSLCDEFEQLPSGKPRINTDTQKNLYYHYLQQIGEGNFFYCKKCGCIEQRTNSRQYLCKECAAEHRKAIRRK